MEKKYRGNYWKEVRRQSWKSAWNKSGMKVIIPSLVILIGAINLGGLLLMIGWVEYPFFRDNLIANFVTGLSQLLFSFVFLLSLFFWFLFQMPPVIHSKQEKEKQELQKVIEENQEQMDSLHKGIKELENQLEEFNRKAEAKMITVHPEEWSGGKAIEIFNGEKRYPFEGRLWVTKVPEKNERGLFEGKVANTGDTIYHVPPKESAIIRIIDIGTSNTPSIAKDAANHIYFSESGEYTIITRVEGRFLYPELAIFSFKSKWKFTVNRESRVFALALVEERFDKEETA